PSLFYIYFLSLHDALPIFHHIFLSFVALAVGVLISIPLGMYVARYRQYAEFIIGVTAVFQTIPSLALFGFLVPLIGIGSKTALVDRKSTRLNSSHVSISYA